LKIVTKYPFPALLVFLLVGFAIYANTLDDEFIFDSFTIISDQYHIQDIDYYLDITNWKLNNRPVANLTFAFNYWLDSANLIGYMIVNILIHILNTFLVFLLTRKMIRTIRPSRDRNSWFGSGEMAFLVALIFLVHPLQTQSVTYVIQRMNTMASMFVLLAVLCYWKSRILQIGRDKIGLSALLMVFAILLGLLGVLSKQNAIIFPLAFFMVELFFIRTPDNRPNRLYLYLFGGIIVLAMLSLVIFGMIPEETEKISRKNYLLTQSRVIIQYIRLMILPFGQNLDYDFAISTSLKDYRVILSSLGLLVIFVAGIFSWKRNRLISFAIFWFFLALSVESSIIPIRDVINEHRCYLALWSYGIVLVIFVDYSEPSKH